MGRGRMAPVIQETVRKLFPVAAQSGRSAFADTTAVPLADGRADDCPEKVCQADRTARIYGVTLCKTEKFPDCFGGWCADQLHLKTL